MKPLPSKEITAIINIYKAHQIFNKEFSTIIFFSICIGGLLMIALSYLIIGFHNLIPSCLLGPVALTLILTFCIFYLATKTAAQLNKSSSIMLSSFK